MRDEKLPEEWVGSSRWSQLQHIQTLVASAEWDVLSVGCYTKNTAVASRSGAVDMQSIRNRWRGFVNEKDDVNDVRKTVNLFSKSTVNQNQEKTVCSFILIPLITSIMANIAWSESLSLKKVLISDRNCVTLCTGIGILSLFVLHHKGTHFLRHMQDSNAFFTPIYSRFY